MPLHSEFVAFLNQLKNMPAPSMAEMTAPMMRELMRSLTALRGQVRQVASVHNLTIPSPGGDINLRLYQPVTHPQNLPAIVYFHGGGHVVGDLDSHDVFCRELALRTTAVVVAVEYRLAPEHPYPAGLDDCYQAFLWAADNIASYGGDVTRLAVAGDSAGGNLTALVALKAHIENGPKIKAQCLIYPELDLTASEPSHEDFSNGFLLTREKILWYFQQYIPQGTALDDPMVSPFFAEKSHFPPSYIITAEYDPLRDEGNKFAKELADVGIEVIHRQAPGMLHGFFLLMAVCPAAYQELEHLCDNFKTLL